MVGRNIVGNYMFCGTLSCNGYVVHRVRLEVSGELSEKEATEIATERMQKFAEDYPGKKERRQDDAKMFL